MRLLRVFFPLALSLMACSLFSPHVFPGPTPAPLTFETIPALPTPTLAGDITPAPTASPAVTLSVGEFTPILYRRYLSRYYEFLVIGGVQDGNWLPASTLADQVRAGQVFDLYAPNGYIGRASAQDEGVPLSNPRCGETYIVTDFSSDIPNLIGVAQGWDVVYRPWQEHAVNTPVYYGAVANWLVSQGFTLPFVKITRILRVDLEGDGVEEVLISAASFRDASGHMTEQGDYSVILMRKIVGSDVVTVPVVADLYTSPAAGQTFPFTYSIASLLDLNQDGNLELIVEVTRWEGSGVIVYEIDGTNIMEALRSVCTE